MVAAPTGTAATSRFTPCCRIELTAATRVEPEYTIIDDQHGVILQRELRCSPIALRVLSSNESSLKSDQWWRGRGETVAFCLIWIPKGGAFLLLTEPTVSCKGLNFHILRYIRVGLMLAILHGVTLVTSDIHFALEIDNETFAIEDDNSVRRVQPGHGL